LTGNYWQNSEASEAKADSVERLREQRLIQQRRAEGSAEFTSLGDILKQMTAQ